MLVQYYENRLIVVGKLWCGSEGSYTYSLQDGDAKFLYNLMDEPELLTKWISKYAGDFQNIKDYQLEVFEKTKLFDDEDSWLLME